MQELEIIEDPDFELLIRTSERSDFARCRQKWWWAYRERLSARQAKPALVFGDLVHQALAAYYPPSKVRTKARRGPHPAQTFRELYAVGIEQLASMGMRMEDEEWTDALSLGVEMLENYVDQYGKDEQFVCIKPEVPFQVELSDADGFYICTYVGTFDAVIIDLATGRYGLFEHKTAKAITLQHLPMDEQAGSYWAFAPYVLEAELLPKLDFVLYNFLRKGKLDDRPQNEDGYYLNKDGSISKRQPSPLFHRELVRRTTAQRANTMRRVEEQAFEMQLIDQGFLKPVKTITRDCYWQCQFADMCELQECGGDWEGYKKVAMTTWNPYEAHTEHPEVTEQ